jgi:hypothetical protein
MSNDPIGEADSPLGTVQLSNLDIDPTMRLGTPSFVVHRVSLHRPSDVHDRLVRWRVDPVWQMRHSK